MRRASPTDRAGPSFGRVVEIPMRCSSSTVPRTATRSPMWSGWSRPGHSSIASSPAGMIATGARCPKWARKVSCMFSRHSTPSCTTAKSTPASSMACEGRSRQASTKDGAANEATSSTLPGPDTRSRARATEGLASWTTSGRSGRISLMRNAVSRVWISSTSTQTTAAARASPASSNPSPRWACRRTCGTPQSCRVRQRRGSASSSITTTGVPLRENCSTARSPTPCRPQTITWPCIAPGSGPSINACCRSGWARRLLQR